MNQVKFPRSWIQELAAFISELERQKINYSVFNIGDDWVVELSGSQ